MIERPEMWAEYVEPAFRDRTPHFATDEPSWTAIASPRDVLLPDLGSRTFGERSSGQAPQKTRKERDR